MDASFKMSSSAYKKKHIVDKIASLAGAEHAEIFKILKSNEVPFSQNSNGCFFDMRLVPDVVVGQIEAFVNYCQDSKKSIEDYNKQASYSITRCNQSHS
jgi:hypothetical protein